MQLDKFSRDRRQRIASALDDDKAAKRFIRRWVGSRINKRLRGEVLFWENEKHEPPIRLDRGEIWVGLDWAAAQPELQPIIAKHVLCS